MKQHLTYFATLLVLLFTSCIKNDIPYPVIPLEIKGITGEGFTVKPNDIDPLTRSVTLQLAEKTDIRKVHITDMEVTSGAIPSEELTGVFDLRAPRYITLTLYQSYQWTLIAKQTIERHFTVEGQIGATEWDLANHTARVSVPKGEVDLKQVKVTSLKLGPAEITTLTPTAEELTNFESMRQVTATYHGDISERWSLYVIPTDITVTLTQADAWTNVLWLYGSGRTGAQMGFRYRIAESTEWLEAPDVKIEEGTFSCRLSVKAETTYEVKAYCNTDESAVKTLRTDAVVQMPNSGFEEWCTLPSGSKQIIYPYLASGTPYWDTGNKGASVASVTLTDKTTDTRPGSTGQYAAYLESVFANIAGIGKFAAGNLFTGIYVKNAGTDGIVTFGRSFTHHPTALKVWVKYTCGAINKIKKVPAGVTIKEGDPDNGHIFIALGTWTPAEYGFTTEKGAPVQYGSADSPVCVDTRNLSTFFQSDGKDVIGYGNLVLTKSVGEWTQYTIPIEYRNTNVVPTNAMIICTASRYGDYFTGSTDSKMWVDDFELIYE
ncbi:MAG: PCMD domain-containing protein [Alistipes sp.]